MKYMLDTTDSRVFMSEDFSEMAETVTHNITYL